MRRVTSTAALFLFLPAAMGTTLHVGWSDFAERASLLASAARVRRSECRPPSCIVCPRPGPSIHWPPEVRRRGRVVHR